MKPLSLLFSVSISVLPGVLLIQSSFQQPPTIALTRAVPARPAADCASLQGLARVVCLAESFKAALTPEQVARLQLPYTKTDAAKWSNFPQGATRPPRVGINLGSLNAAQLAAAKALMALVLVSGVPNEGFDELEGGLAADDYLGTTLGKSNMFGSGNFYLAFLGTPSTTGLWELQYGGHHYAFANTYNGGTLSGVTPSFRGVEPMSTVTANGKTYQPMEQERQAFAEVLGSLSSGEQSVARLSSTFREVVLGPGMDGQFPATKLGQKVGELSAAKQKLVLEAVKRYVNDLDPAAAAKVLARYTAELPDTYLAYSGSGTMGQQNDYVRIDGPSVWIEYSGQPSRDFPGTVHPHSVWRDRTSDYGGN